MCLECQKSDDRRLTYGKQIPIISFGPFEKWGLDAIGPLPMAQSRKQYIIVGVDYMTRWAEATTTSRIKAKDVAKFVFENICCKFGTFLEIIFDRGPSFRGDLVGELMEQLGISRRHSSPYYPQCSGLVKKVNVLPSDHSGYTAYQLVFGKEAIFPNEVQLASLRVLACGRDRPSEQLRCRILELEGLELDRTAAIEHYAGQVEHHRKKFDENLNDKGLKKRMFVLRYDNRFDTRKDKKFMNRWEGLFLIYKKYTNGSYRLQDISGKLHKTRVNGWRLKPFFRALIQLALKIHQEQQSAERQKLAKHREKCLEKKDQYLGLVIDGMDQKKTLLPHFLRPPKNLKEENFVQLHVVGALIFNGVMTSRVFINFPNLHNDPNLTVTVIQKILTEWEGALPRTLYVQLDNTAQENNNQVLMAYLSMLVEKKVFKKVKLGFLLVGHTHDQIDQMFSKISVKLAKKSAFDLPKICEVLRESYEPQSEVHVLKGTYDFREFATGGNLGALSFMQLNDHSFQHQFKIKQKDGEPRL
ncbi:hypothetical protein L7F22_061815 [Adiantum nelumboides]|nr:hypothetical protein [Adiantum nelumboides]